METIVEVKGWSAKISPFYVTIKRKKWISLAAGGVMGRPRKVEGTRQKDQIKNVIVKLPTEIFKEIEKKGVPSDILRQDAINKYKISD